MNILFVCIANSARSQIAEGLAKALLSKSVAVQSAGSAPSGQVNEYAVQVMNEIGIDISRHKSKHWDSLPQSFLASVNFVITLCEEECPNVGIKSQKLSWAFEDPAAVKGSKAEMLDSFRKTRDEIKNKIVNLGKENGLF